MHLSMLLKQLTKRRLVSFDTYRHRYLSLKNIMTQNAPPRRYSRSTSDFH